MPESPKSQRRVKENESSEPAMHPLAKIIAENGGTLRLAYGACMIFLQRGSDVKMVKEMVGDEQGEHREGEQMWQVVEVQDEEKHPDAVKPKMSLSHPGLPELEALARTLPWMAGIKPETCPTWRQAVRSAPESTVVRHEQSAFRKWAETLLKSVASL